MWVMHSELADDVVLYFLRCSRRECQYRWPSQTFCNRAESEIIGTEVVSPLTYAVSLIDYEETHLARKKSLEEIAILESLGSEIEKLAFAFFDLPVCFARFASREMRMHCDSIDALG